MCMYYIGDFSLHVDVACNSCMWASCCLCVVATCNDCMHATGPSAFSCYMHACLIVSFNPLQRKKQKIFMECVSRRCYECIGHLV